MVLIFIKEEVKHFWNKAFCFYERRKKSCTNNIKYNKNGFCGTKMKTFFRVDYERNYPYILWWPLKQSK